MHVYELRDILVKNEIEFDELGEVLIEGNPSLINYVEVDDDGNLVLSYRD